MKPNHLLAHAQVRPFYAPGRQVSIALDTIYGRWDSGKLVRFVADNEGKRPFEQLPDGRLALVVSCRNSVVTVVIVVNYHLRPLVVSYDNLRQLTTVTTNCRKSAFFLVLS
jgi:hypothetical protein